MNIIRSLAYRQCIAIALVFVTLAACKPARTQSPGAPWPALSNTAYPWTRWWWMGNAVDSSNLQYLLQQYHQAHIGGVEVVPIYGVKGYEDREIDYLSPRWMQMLDYTTQQAASLDMGVDISFGTGWPCGGPWISSNDAATKLIVQTYTLRAGEKLSHPISVDDPKQQLPGVALTGLIAYDQQGHTQELTALTDSTGHLNWSPDSGTWTLYAAFTGKTRQIVKRFSPGGKGYTLDHFSDEAFHAYTTAYNNAFKGSKHGIRSIYNDSYEVYGADWSPAFFSTFKRVAGYDLLPWLRYLADDDSSETAARVKSDYRYTLGRMLLANFADNLTQWSHQLGARSINQAHGSPGNLLDLYAASDQPETETFGSSYFPIPGLRRDSADVRNVDPDPFMLKFASSAAHVTGKPLVSSETFTWLTEHFKTALSQCKPEVEQVFLSGINHVFFHGSTYSPKEAAWPGWLFYASVEFNPTNSFWPHLQGMNDYIARCQSVLQAGQPDNDLLMYWPVFDIWHNPKGRTISLAMHNIDDWLHPTDFYRLSDSLSDEGYSLDFVSDQMLTDHLTVKDGQLQATGGRYKAIIVPRCTMMPAKTLQTLLQLAQSGATIIFRSLPQDVPGLYKLEQQRQLFQQLLQGLHWQSENGTRVAKTGQGKVIVSAEVTEALMKTHIAPETFAHTGLQFIRRKAGDDYYYYVVNHTAHAIDESITLLHPSYSTLLLDPQSGKYGVVKSKHTKETTRLRLQLEPGEALIVRLLPGPAVSNWPPWRYLVPQGKAQEADSGWTLQFTQGGPALPAATHLDHLTSWTQLPDTTAMHFSGTAVYTGTFTIPQKATAYLLQLGKVAESAHVWINGKDAGFVWSFPYQLRLTTGNLLQKGANTIRIEVCNLMANRIRYMDQQKIPWKIFHDINIVDINYKPFNAAGWQPMPAGLLGPVVLQPCGVVE